MEDLTVLELYEQLKDLVKAGHGDYTIDFDATKWEYDTQYYRVSRGTYIDDKNKCLSLGGYRV